VEIHNDILGFNVDSCQTTEKCYSSYKSTFDELSKNPASLAEINGLKFVKNIITDGLHPVQELYLERSDNHAIYNIDMEWGADDTQGQGLLNDILSTFTVTPQQVQTITSTLKTYTDNVNGFSFEYPNNYKIGKDVGGADIPVQNYFISGGDTIITADMPDTYPSNTDFSDAFFSVGINNQLNAQDCQKSVNYDIASSVNLTTTRIINGSTFYVGNYISNLPANKASDDFYHAYHNGVCYELVTELRTKNIGTNSEVNSKDVFDKLNNILKTFKFTK
jgi:hypothetical protein